MEVLKIIPMYLHVVKIGANEVSETLVSIIVRKTIKIRACHSFKFYSD